MRQVIACIAFCICAAAQSTDGTITGRVLDATTKRGIDRATVTYTNLNTAESRSAPTDGSGYYSLMPLAPGPYYVRAEFRKDGKAMLYQPREVYEIELPVAGRIEIEFALRPLTDVYDQHLYTSQFVEDSGTIVRVYASDVQTLRPTGLRIPRLRQATPEASISSVIDPVQLQQLPFFGRDAYAMLATQAGVASDATTARGLGLAASGQRPSASNVLLDGLELNNYLTSGPLIAIAPESIQEYRISTNYFSAEYGSTSGFLANAVSRAGGADWHGIVYAYLKNDALNAGGFEASTQTASKPPDNETQGGFQVGGPLSRRHSVFASASYERLASRGHAVETGYQVPSAKLLSDLQEFYPNTIARQLLTAYPPPPSTAANPEDWFGVATLAPSVTFDRTLALGRLDYVHGSSQVMGRFAASRFSRPDFIWSPYPAFTSGLEQPVDSLALAFITSPRPNLTNELRGGWNRDELSWNRPHPEIPGLLSEDGTWLPSSLAGYEYRDRSHAWQVSDTLLWTRGRHAARFGGGVLLRGIDHDQSVGRDGQYAFQTTLDFAFDTPHSFRSALSREGLARQQLQLPEYPRTYRYNQFNLFAQDTIRATSRLSLNLGIRYENFGAPANTGPVKDVLLQLGPGTGMPQQISTSKLVYGGTGDQQLYDPDNRGFAGRFGLTYDLTGKGRAILRAAYGIFYDRPFDNLWLNVSNNAYVVPTGFDIDTTKATNYLEPVPAALQHYQQQFLSRGITEDFPPLTYLQQDFKNAYAQHSFLGVQWRLANNLSVETNGLLSLGRRLLTTDIVNRQFSVGSARYNPALPNISYRGTEGLSDYSAFTAIFRYRGARSFFQLAYTWSHSIDLQSEPLAAGDFSNLLIASPKGLQNRSVSATFTRQLDSRADRGDSDFDQRHNLVFYSYWDLPQAFGGTWAGAIFRNWGFAQVAAVRSGVPFSVNAQVDVPATGGTLFQNRADVTDPAHASIRQPLACASGPCGVRLLDPDAFAAPVGGVLGTSGRNAFAGPGFYSLDISLSRKFPLSIRERKAAVTLRSDIFNVFNHANLSQPVSFYDPANLAAFGIATYGRRGTPAGFPALSPFVETGRQVQIMLRLEF